MDIQRWNAYLDQMERITQRMASMVYTDTKGEQRRSLSVSLSRLVKRIEDTKLED